MVHCTKILFNCLFASLLFTKFFSSEYAGVEGSHFDFQWLPFHILINNIVNNYLYSGNPIHLLGLIAKIRYAIIDNHFELQLFHSSRETSKFYVDVSNAIFYFYQTLSQTL